MENGLWLMLWLLLSFMSYIGFSGIITSQLSQLEKISNRVSILTTNDSDIKSGFFFFTGFVILGIYISQIIFNKFELKKPAENNV